MTLNAWSKNGWLTRHQTSRQEITELLELADRDLAASQTQGLDVDWRLTIAYNAALQLATAALAASGYRAEREAHHYRVFQSLALTIGADESLVRRLDLLRRKRNTIQYERIGTVSDQEAAEMLALAVRLREAVREWLQEKHPELMG